MSVRCNSNIIYDLPYTAEFHRISHPFLLLYIKLLDSTNIFPYKDILMLTANNPKILLI